MEKPAGDKRHVRAGNDTSVQALGRQLGDLTLACECGHEGCSEELTIAKSVYRKVRRYDTWYLLVAGHETVAEERVVLRQPSFVVVESM